MGCTYLFFCKSLSECEYIFGITITVLKISQNNDNRGCHLEFYFHTGIISRVSGTGFSASQFTPVSILVPVPVPVPFPAPVPDSGFSTRPI